MSDSDRPEWLVVGQISKPHGNKGEVFVWPLTDSPDAVFAEGRELLLGDTEGEPGEDLEKLTGFLEELGVIDDARRPTWIEHGLAA